MVKQSVACTIVLNLIKLMGRKARFSQICSVCMSFLAYKS